MSDADDARGTAPNRDAERLRSGKQAIAHWAGFPAAEPRPVVLLDSDVRVEGGFATGDAKIAFLRGVVKAAPGVPEEPMRLLRAPHARVSHPGRATLRVTAATLAHTEFATDRGPQRLPAWRVEAVDALGPIWVLAEEAQVRCWSPPEVPDGERIGPHILISATVGPEGRELIVEFTGGGESLFRYEAEAVESAAAVSVVPLERMTRQLPTGTAITMEGHRRDVRVTLAEALGSRVLVNLDGTPVPVHSA